MCRTIERYAPKHLASVSNEASRDKQKRDFYSNKIDATKKHYIEPLGLSGSI
jgi:hypothetical protein